MEDRRRRDGECTAEAASEYAVRARFYAIGQADGERAYDWFERVRSAAARCGFGVHRRAAAIADKFVTGLRPGPVADRLLGRRADGPLDELLAAAVETETGLPRRMRLRPGPAMPPDHRNVLAEIREGLKLYRYSDGADSSTCNDPIAVGVNAWWLNRIGTTEPKRPAAGADGTVGYRPLTCRSCCHLATRLLESLDAQFTSNSSRPDDSNNDDYHDNYSKCYCSRL